jgi:hypothetical protein
MHIRTTLPRLAQVAFAVALLPFCFPQRCAAWGADGHRMINRVAAQNLPKEVPAFLRDGTALDTMEYLGPEPDRWKNRAESELSATQSPDHFLDEEYSDLLGPLPRKRYDYIRLVDAYARAHPELNLTAEKIGFQPWQVEEVYERLKSSMREYRHLLADNADTHPDELAILFYAGWLGHYVADGSQPLHDTIQFNGWTGANPNAYATDHKIHAKFESIFVTANIPRAEVNALVAATPPKLLSDEWIDYLGYLHHSGILVEKLYQLDKAGAFDGAGTPAGKAFVEERLAAGAIELRDMIETAWVRSGDPVDDYHGPQ